MRKGSLGVTFFSVCMYVRKFWEIQFGMPGMAGDGRKWPGVARDGRRDDRYRTPAHTQQQTHTLFSKEPFLVIFFWKNTPKEKAHVRLLGTQEYFSYLPDEPYARDLQACALRFFKNW